MRIYYSLLAKLEAKSSVKISCRVAIVNQITSKKLMMIGKMSFVSLCIAAYGISAFFLTSQHR